MASDRKIKRPGQKVRTIARRNPGRSFPIVGVGASAGGLEAFTQLLKHLPADTGMGFVLVQHLDRLHPSALAQLLAKATSMPVAEATEGVRIEPNKIHVIPPNKILSIADGRLRLKRRPTGPTLSRSIDFFLESLAHDQREQAIGVILSGTAMDGTLGLEAIKSEGGITFVQDASAKYASMPRSAVAAGCVDFELSPKEIALELARIAAHPLVAGRRAKSAVGGDAASSLRHEDDATAPPASGPGPGDNHFKQILQLVHSHSKVDFSLYKPATISRRINRRMVLSQAGTLPAYAKFLRGNAGELEALYSDMLICVTSFFRNPEAFDLLKRKVFIPLLAQRSAEPVRVWVLGCSTGQEPYSIAMAFAEAGGSAPPARKIQIFATDLNNALLEKARAGLYARNLSHEVSPERLARFFVEEPTGYRVRKDLRESVVFARQNVLHDPPFSRIDLISCRNLLIYIEPHLQKRILPMFHYALNPGGTLFLGASEAVTGYTDLFAPIDRRQKLFTRKPGQATGRNLPVASLRSPAQPKRAAVHAPAALPATLPPELHAQREADRLTVNQFAPPGVLVNDALQILQFRGPTGAYLEPARGKASFDVLKMAREGLALPLRAAINRARREGKPVHKQRIPLRQDGQVRLVNIQVTPLKNISERCFLILFDEKARADPAPPGNAQRAEPAPSTRRLHALEGELTEVRDYLQTVQEQHEAAHGELQAANEEVTSANEELQSLNEELETSKEELESSNEELMTVNEEMNHRNSELNRLNADLNNLHLSISTAIVVINLDLTIRSFTPQAEKTFNFLATDLGRPLSGIRHNLELSPIASKRRLKSRKGETLPGSLEDFVREAITTGGARECEVRNGAGQWFSLKVRPYLTQDNRIDGAVLMLVDIDRLKRAEQETRSARDYAEAVLRTARDPLLVLHADLSVNTANDAFYRTFKTTRAETEGRLLWDLGDGQWDLPRLRQWLKDVLPRKSFFDDLEVQHDFPTLGPRTMLLNARQLETAGDAPPMILLGIEDVTERYRLDDSVRHSEERFRALAVASSQIVWTADVDGGMQERDAQSWQDFTGQAYAHARGTGWLDAIHPDDREQAKINWRRCLAARLPMRTEYRLRRKDGTYRWASVHATPVFTRDGGIREWIGTHTDITDRKQAEASLVTSEARYRSLFDSMDEGFCVIEMIAPAGGEPLDYRFLEVNPSFEKQTGLKDVQGRLMRTISPQHEEHWFEIYHQVAQTGDPIRFVNEAKSLGRWFDVYAFRLPLDDRRRVAVLFKDITAQRRDALELERARDKALAASRSKDEFLATLSHELRTPLNPAMLLASYNAGNHDLPDDVRADFETIRNNIGLEARLIDDLLDLTLIVSGKLRLELQSCDVHTILRDAIAIVQPDLTDKRLRLSLDQQAGFAGIRADGVRLQQVFWNILRNAIHFTPVGGGITVATRSDAPGDTLTVTLTDTGSGIPAKDLERIFDAFSQGEVLPGVARRGGLGLGLAISRKMVELHGGSIHATSPGPGQGSSFVVTLPLQPKAERAPALTAAPALGLTATGPTDPFNRLLLVDDHVPTLAIMGALLERQGYQVKTARSVSEAVSVAKTQSVDVVISDIGLPDGDGYGLLSQLQLQQPQVQGIALSGYGTREDIARSHAAGFADHLIKPLEINTLTRALERLRERT